jgi:hypothetical protein
MSEIKLIPGPGGRTYTHGSDEYGDFGSVFHSEEEDSIPPPLDFAPADEELKRKSRATVSELSEQASD